MSSPEKHEPEERQDKILESLLTRVPSAEEQDKIESLEDGEGNIPKSDEVYCDAWGQGGTSYEITEAGIDNLLRERIDGGLLIDLGGGHGDIKKILEFSYGIKLKNYINVDKFIFRNDPELGKRTQHGIKHGESGDTTKISAGILEFLQYVEDNTVNAISINGIDSFMVHDRRYHEEIARQIQRVLKNGGIVFGNESVAIRDLMHDENMEIKWQSEILPKMAVLEKKEPKKE